MEFQWLEGAQIEGKKQTAAFRRKAAVVVAQPRLDSLCVHRNELSRSRWIADRIILRRTRCVPVRRHRFMRPSVRSDRQGVGTFAGTAGADFLVCADRTDGGLPGSVAAVRPVRASTPYHQPHGHVCAPHIDHGLGDERHATDRSAICDGDCAWRGNSKRGGADDRVQSQTPAGDICPCPLLRLFAGLRRGWRRRRMDHPAARLAFSALDRRNCAAHARVFVFIFLPESIDFLVRTKAEPESIWRVVRSVDRALPNQGPLVFTAPVEEKRSAVGSLFQSDRTFGTLVLWLVFGLNLAECYALQSWLPTILTNLGHSLNTVALATSLMEFGGIVAAFVIGPAMDRLGPYGSLATVYFAGVVFVALLGLAISAPSRVLLIAAFCAGFCISGGQKSVIALAAIF
jgi:Major Facilitator Superfamily